MTRTIVIYAGLMAVGAFALQWLEYQYAVRVFSTEIYIVALALGFTALGIWTGYRLTARRPSDQAEPNQKALNALGITEREQEVLRLLVAGCSNPEIAAKLFVSPNTVKTHLANLYRKLEVSRRTQAVIKARELRLVI